MEGNIYVIFKFDFPSKYCAPSSIWTWSNTTFFAFSWSSKLSFQEYGPRRYDRNVNRNMSRKPCNGTSFLNLHLQERNKPKRWLRSWIQSYFSMDWVYHINVPVSFGWIFCHCALHPTSIIGKLFFNSAFPGLYSSIHSKYYLNPMLLFTCFSFIESHAKILSVQTWFPLQSSAIEFWTRFFLFKTCNSLFASRFGLALVVVFGQLLRSIAMKTCGEYFNHYIQHTNEDSHRLITNGM